LAKYFSLKQHSVDRQITDHSSTMVVLPQLHQEMVVLKRYVNHSFCHVVSTLVLGWDQKDFKESLIIGVPEVVIFHMEVSGAACEVVSHCQQVSCTVVFENSCMNHHWISCGMQSSVTSSKIKLWMGRMAQRACDRELFSAKVVLKQIS
jgi:hypothetical protein